MVLPVLSALCQQRIQSEMSRRAPKASQTRSDDLPVTDADEGLESVQSLAYDAERWPHCIEVCQ